MWTNYGDANPLEWGGLWIEKDKEHCYRVISLDLIDDDGEYLFCDCYVDLTDSWINWQEVFRYAGYGHDISEEDAVIALLDYYPSLNFGGCERAIDKEEVLKELEAYEILVS